MIIFGHFLVDKNIDRIVIECPSRDDIKQIQHFSNYTVSIETANLPDATIYLAADINHNVFGLAALVPFNKEIRAVYREPNNTL